MDSSKQLFIAMLACFLFITTIAECQSDLSHGTILQKHDQWMKKFNRSYSSNEEKAHRFTIFKQNFAHINNHNDQSNGFTLSINQFADLTHDEFRAMYLESSLHSSNSAAKTPKSEVMPRATPCPSPSPPSPSSIDWRTLGAVTAIKNQGSSATAWAFSAVAAIEGAVKITTGSLNTLSEQLLVNCAVPGGSMDNSFHWVTQNGGLNQALSSGCVPNAKAAKIKGYIDVFENDEIALRNAVSKQPVSVYLDASSSFQFYSGGIFAGPCGYTLNHAVTLVGYGASGNTNFWIVKNSWGTSWGESGYMRLKRGHSDSRGLCGISIKPSYPVICR